MKAQRRRHDAAFKARVALEALKGIKTIQQIAKEYEVHPTQVSTWKTTLQERLAQAFEGGPGSKGGQDFERERADLHAKIGELTIQVDFLQKKSKQLGL
jgi:transposase-like protein